MKPAVHHASARQCAGGPSPVLAVGGNRNGRARKPGLIEVETGIAELVDQSTHDLRVAWRRVHRTEPPLGLSRDLLIRALAHQLQERTRDGANRALQRRLQILAKEFEKGGASYDPGIGLKSGTTLVRQWRGHTTPSWFARTVSNMRVSVIAR